MAALCVFNINHAVFVAGVVLIRAVINVSFSTVYVYTLEVIRELDSSIIDDGLGGSVIPHWSEIVRLEWRLH